MTKESGRFEIPEPTEDDDENIGLHKAIQIVVLHFRKSKAPLTAEQKAKKVEPKDQLELYFLRIGGDGIPELMWGSTTNLNRFKALNAQIVRAGKHPSMVVVELEGEKVSSDATGYKWSAFKGKVLRALTEEELAYTQPLIGPIKERIARYSFDDAADDLFDAASAGLVGKQAIEAATNHDPEELAAKAKTKSVLESGEDEDEDEAPKPAPKPKPAPAKEEEPEPTEKPKAKEEEPEPTDKPKPAPKPAKPSLLDD